MNEEFYRGFSETSSLSLIKDLVCLREEGLAFSAELLLRLECFRDFVLKFVKKLEFDFCWRIFFLVCLIRFCRNALLIDEPASTGWWSISIVKLITSFYPVLEEC